jgi:4-hydroxy-tetrahydrodipicolinate reductase
MLDLAKKMAAALKDAGYSFAIAETHHESKLDSPSGTAITLAEAVRSTLGVELPIHASRTGDVAGIHSLVATGSGDTITLTHESASRRPFAEGAVRAAEWLIQAKPGVYDIRNIFAKL